LFDAMINEANASSSACRLWRISQVETGAPPKANEYIFARCVLLVKICSSGKFKEEAASFNLKTENQSFLHLLVVPRFPGKARRK